MKIAFGDNPLEDSGISLPQLTLLDWVAANPGSNLSDIAEGINLSPPTVSVGIRRLENVGVLQRVP
ncbi:MAG: helix-turn-helix domain-containing protein, partial [Anaerolineae bacterium]|nr:helix-turn-helix domain-containing protein [Anaerolineae bacterium]